MESRAGNEVFFNSLNLTGLLKSCGMQSQPKPNQYCNSLGIDLGLVLAFVYSWSRSWSCTFVKIKTKVFI